MRKYEVLWLNHLTSNLMMLSCELLLERHALGQTAGLLVTSTCANCFRPKWLAPSFVSWCALEMLGGTISA